MYCNKCGERNSNSAIECKKCGAIMYNPNFIGDVVHNGQVIIQEGVYKGTLKYYKAKHNPNTELLRLIKCPHCKSSLTWWWGDNCYVCGEPLYYIARTVEPFTKKSVRKSIRRQFRNDKSSICPVCGSHSVSIRRRGYDWNMAWWGSILKAPDWKYIAGMGSDLKMGHCNHCGNKWYL